MIAVVRNIVKLCYGHHLVARPGPFGFGQAEFATEFSIIPQLRAAFSSDVRLVDPTVQVQGENGSEYY